jgi:hypothetical protein
MFIERRDRRVLCGALTLALATAWGAPPAGARSRRAVKVAARGGAKAEAKAAPAGRAAGNGPSVVFATDKRAYLNRGARDGLTAKQSVSLYRGGRAAGSCTIETLAQHQASCTGGRPRVGDSFRLPAAGAAQRAQAPVPKLPPRDDEVTLRARAAAIADAHYDKVDFNGEHAIAGHAHAQLAPGVVVWRTTPDAGGDTTLFEVDADVHVYDVAGTGANFDAAFSAMRWSGQAADGRFRPGAQSQFYLWEAALSKRRAEGRTVFAVGRIWPWHTPGLALLDGMQVGRRNQSETMEGGIYAGALPRELSVAPTLSSWASGAYAALVQPGSSKGVFRLAREEARIGISDAPETGFVADGEALAQAWLAGWNVAAGGRVVRSTVRAPQPTLDRAYVDLGSRPTLAFGLGLHLRYFGGVLPAPAPLVAVTPAGRFLGGAADARWDPAGWLGFAAFAGAHRDNQSGLTQGYAAAEVRLPRIIGVGGVAGGAEVDEGWLRSRLAYGQLAARFGERVRLLARVSVAANAYTTPVSSPNIHELGGYLHLDGDLAAWLRLRAWSLLRVPLLIQGEFPGEATFGASGGLTLVGGF